MTQASVEIFQQYCDIYDVEWDHRAIADHIIQHPTTHIITHHRVWYLFWWFAQYVQKNREFEDFLRMWDISHDMKIRDYQLKHPSNIRSLTALYESNRAMEHTTVIVDTPSFVFAQHSLQESLWLRETTLLASDTFLFHS